MNFLTSKAGTCCIIGRPDIPPGFSIILRRELDNLIVHGVTCYLFTGTGPFERLCIDALHHFKLQYPYILTGIDISLLQTFASDFDALFCLRPQLDPSFSLNRIAIEHSRFMIYFKQTDYGGAHSDIVYGEGLGVRAINIAARKESNAP